MEQAFSSGFLDVLWKVSWQAAVLAAVVWVICRLAGNAPGRLRHALWAVVLVKFFIPPFAYLPAGMAFWQEAEPAPPPPAVTVAPAPALPQPVRDAAGQASPPSEAAAPSTLEPSGIALPAPQDLAALLWAFGVGIMLAALLARLRRQAGLVQRSVPADALLAALLDSAARRLALRRPPELRVSEELTTPALVGFFRQTILIPIGLVESCTDNDLDAILLHELAHVKRHDMAALWLHQAAQVIFFFHPAVWLAGRELKRERELACDELVLSASGIAASDYAAGYVSALKLANAAGKVPVSVAMAEPFEVEKSRLTRILRGQSARLSGAWLIVLLGVIAVGIPTFLGVRIKRETPVPPAAPPEKVALTFSAPMDRRLEFTKPLPKPMVCKQGRITAKVTAIGSEPSSAVPGATEFLIIGDLTGPADSWDFSDARLVDDRGRVILSRGFGQRGIRGRTRKTWRFAPGPVGAKTIREFSGTMACRLPDVEHTLGPCSLQELAKPVVVERGKLVLEVAGCSVADLPASVPRGVYGDLSSSGTTRGSLAASGLTDKGNHVILRLNTLRSRPKTVRGFGVGAPGLAFSVRAPDGRWMRLDCRCSITHTRPEKPIRFAAGPYVGMRLRRLPVAGRGESHAAAGIPVEFVDSGGPAEKAGIKPGDVLVRVGSTRISGPYDADRALGDLRSEQVRRGVRLPVQVTRSGKVVRLTILATPDPVFGPMIASAGPAWKRLRKHLKSNDSELEIATYVSTQPVPRDFRPDEVVVQATIPVPPIPFRFKFTNIPIPPGFWKQAAEAAQRGTVEQTGKVVDLRSGGPVAGVTVLLTGDGLGYGPGYQPPTQAARATSRRDGSFSFKGVIPGRRYYLIPTGDRWVRQMGKAIYVGHQGPVPRTIVVSQGQPISGVVKTPDGLPVAGVHIVADQNGSFPYGETNSDARGRFRIEHLPPGRIHLVATRWKPGVGEFRGELSDVVVGSRNVAIILKPPARDGSVRL